MDLETYEKSGRAAYQDLARTVGSIIETVGATASDYRIQQVQGRAKGVDSLRKKLGQRGVAGTESVEAAVKDLAGCRVILYTNADVARFISQGVIADNFEVDWVRTKFHYPSAEPTADDGFISYNYVVRLKDDRLKLPEYERFADMWCEVQVQTTLDHAWSEMAHDTIYKPPPKGFGGEVMKSVSARMTDIMQKYLRPAGFEFQKVAADVRALERGRALLAANPLQRLRDAQDNNQRHDLLGEFKEHVLPFYDDPASVADEIRATMAEVIDAARSTPEKPREGLEILFGSAKSHWVVSSALEVVNDLRFVSAEAVDATFKLLLRLYPAADSEEQRVLNESIEKLAKHDLHVWQAAGPLVQQRLVSLIQELSPEERRAAQPLIVKALHNVLKPDLTGATTTYNAFTLHQGAVIASDVFLTIRRDAISILQDLFASATSERERVDILYAFEAAGRTPLQGQLTKPLYQATLTDSAAVVAFLTERADALSFEFLQRAEHDYLWRFRHTSQLPPQFAADAELEAARVALRDAILAFRDRLNRDADFVVYKTLVGFQSVFPMAWDQATVEIDAEAAYRTAQIERLAAAVNDDTFDYWLRIIRRCAQTKSNDLATFPSFQAFLVSVGRHNPALLSRLFEHIDEDLGWFVSSMLLGLQDGPFAGEIARRTTEWVEQKRHLVQLAAYCVQSRVLDEPLLEAVVGAAIAADDRRALGISMEACVRRDAEALNGLGNLFERILDHFVAKQDPDWVSAIWFRFTNGGLVQRLSHETKLRILSNLVLLPRVDFHAEEVIRAVAGDTPDDIIEFFHQRIQREAQREAGDSDYDDIPYDFHILDGVMASSGAAVVTAARRWFDESEELFEYRAGALVPRLYSDLAPVEGPLLDLVRIGTDRDVEFVLRVLSAYKGQSFIQPIVKAIIERLEPESALLDKVGFALDQSGVLSGEFGLVELYRARKAEMEPWLRDENERVRIFADRRVREFDLQIAAEQRRSLEGLELRKREFGE